MRISRKRISQAPSLAASPYVLGDNALSVVTSQKDLGVTVNNTLTWSLHVSLVVAKANRMLGFLRRHCVYIGPDRKKLLYLTFVRSHMGYASEIWAPQSCISDIRLLEGVQRRATRFILSCHPNPDLRPGYKSRLISLGMLPISYWLECRDLCFMYKAVNGAYNFPLNNYVSFNCGRTRSSSSNLNLRPMRFRTSLFRLLF